MRELYVFLPLFWGISLFALLCGGKDERAVAIIYGLAVIVSPFVTRTPQQSFSGVEGGLLIVDGALFFGVAIVAVSSKQFWPLWVSWTLGMMLLAHLSPLLGPRISPWGYALAEKFWSYLPLFILGLATWQHRRRKSRDRFAATG